MITSENMKPYRHRGTKYTESHRWLPGFPGQGEDPKYPPVLPQNIIWRMIFCSEFMTSSTPLMSVTRLTIDSETNRVRATCTCCIICFATCIMPLWHMQYSPERQVSPFIHLSLLVQVAEEKKFKLLQHLALSNL